MKTNFDSVGRIRAMDRTQIPGWFWLAVLLLAAFALPIAQAAAGFANGPSLATARYYHTATLLPSGKVLVAGGLSSGNSALNNAELYDPATNSWSAAGVLATARYVHTATLLPSGKVLVAGGADSLGKPLASAELYDPATNSWSSAGALATARYVHTATLFPSGKVLATGGLGASSVLASTEIYDPATNSWSAAGTFMTARYDHTATLLPSGNLLATGGADTNGVLSSAELYDPVTATWSAVAPLTTARQVHSATLLPSGKVLVAGGLGTSGVVASAELYDPTTNSWSAASALATARYYHSVALLPSGKVLVAGGLGPSSAIASAELYDPATNSWSATGAFATARYLDTATLLPTGKVLAIGGLNGSALASTELYDPATTSWSAAGVLATTRYVHTATLLPSGKVLVAGGFGSSSAIASAELYDPVTKTWSAASPLATARYDHTATLLPSGRVLVVGGSDNNDIASVEQYDPATNTWSAASPLATGRFLHTATLLASGKLLVAGGFAMTGVVASTELYDPATDSWSAAGALATARYGHTATLLPSGKVLVAGGTGTGNSALTSAELYDPTSDSWSPAGSLSTISHTATLLSSGKVLVAGGRFGGPSAELYDPATNTWGAAGALATARSNHTATLLPSGKVLVVGGAVTSGFLASAELYDPTTNSWSAAGALTTACAFPTATLLPSGQVLLAGGDGNSSILASAELFDAGLAPVAARQPSLSATNAFLLQTSPLAATSMGSAISSGKVTATGFAPRLQASGGATSDSASNMPVFQVQRMDNDQMRFVSNDEAVSFTDTVFTGSATAFAGFPSGPVRVRVWVNGIPSAERYSTLAVTAGRPTAPAATGGVSRATVTFTIPNDNGGAPITHYTATALPGGMTASCSAPCTSIAFNPIMAGTYTFTVTATNAAGNGPSSAASNSVVVVTGTTTNVSSSTNPSSFGQSLTFIATVAPIGLSSDTPTGTITFFDGGSSIGTGILEGGTATVVTSTLATGSHTITTSYGGDANFIGSAGVLAGNPQVVRKANTTTSVTASANPSVFGQAITFTATVSLAPPGAGAPTGMVTFLDGGNPIGGGALDRGSATFTTLTLTVGSHTITANYPGDGNFNASTASSAHSVDPFATSTSIGTVVPSNAHVGETVTVTYSVSNITSGPWPAVPASDTVVVSSGAGNPTCTASVGTGRCELMFTAAGNYDVSASYAGSTNYAPSQSASTISVSISKNLTTTSVASTTPNPSLLAQPVNVKVNVGDTTGGPTPTGTVNVVADTGETCAVGSLSAGVGFCSLVLNHPGARTLTVTYNGDAANADSSGTATQNVTAHIAANGSTTFSGVAGATLPGALPSVKATDANGNPVAGIAIMFTAGANSGTLSGSSQTTDASGTATLDGWTLGTLDSETLSAAGALLNLDGAPIVFTASVSPSFDASVNITDNQTFVQYGHTLDYVIVVDNDGPSIANVKVTDVLPPELDVSGAHWTCFSHSPDATCTANGSGDLSDTPSIPSGGNVTYVLSATVKTQLNIGNEIVVDQVNLEIGNDNNSSNNSAVSSTRIVIYRDGFELGGNGAGSGMVRPIDVEDITTLDAEGASGLSHR